MILLGLMAALGAAAGLALYLVAGVLGWQGETAALLSGVLGTMAGAVAVAWLGRDHGT